MKLHQRLLCEFIGTFTLIFAGCAAICANAGLVAVALAHGLALAVMISALGAISGGHFNPAVSLAAALTGKMKSAEFFPYLLAQLLGGAAGAYMVAGIFPADAVVAANLGTPALGAGVNNVRGILAELIMTFFLVLVVFGTAIDARAPKCGGLFIGLVVAMDILAGGSITGAAMNPARAFGPALVSGIWKCQLVYWIGPALGALIAGLLYTKILAEEK